MAIHSALIERLRNDKRLAAENPKSCENNAPHYPCSDDCPCALRDLVLDLADALNATAD